jgi:elongation factor P
MKPGIIALFLDFIKGIHVMAIILATEIRVGQLLVVDKKLCKVLNSYHVHVGGRGGAYMQVEMRDIERGNKIHNRFNTDEKVEKAHIDSVEMEYLYQDGEQYVFMNNSTYEQILVDGTSLDGQEKYLLPNTTVKVNFYQDRIFSVEFPQTVILTIMETEPNIKGATATGSFKAATTETGLIVQVPQFLESGEKIKVNTDTGQYMEKA